MPFLWNGSRGWLPREKANEGPRQLAVEIGTQEAVVVSKLDPRLPPCNPKPPFLRIGGFSLLDQNIQRGRLRPLKVRRIIPRRCQKYPPGLAIASRIATTGAKAPYLKPRTNDD